MGIEAGTADWVGAIAQAIQVAALVVGGIVAYLRFGREAPHRPRIEFDLECRFLAPQQGAHLCEISLIAHNRGLVEHRFDEIRLRIRGIENGTPLVLRRASSPASPNGVSATPRAPLPSAEFPKVLTKGLNIVPPEFGYYFVRPGVRQRITHCTVIPAGVRFIAVRATFRYGATGDLHTAERVFDVRASDDTPSHSAVTADE